MFAEKQQRGGGCDDGDGEIGSEAFRAIDLFENVPQSDFSLNHDAIPELQFTPPIEVLSERESEGTVDEQSPLSYCPTSEGADGFAVVPPSQPVAVPSSDVTVSASQWDLLIAGDFAQYRQEHSSLKFPWEEGVLADIFNQNDGLDLPECQGFITAPEVGGTEMQAGVDAGPSASLGDAKYVKAVQNLKDVTYFEYKNQKLQLACSQWLDLLSIDWKASQIGPRLAESLFEDSSGAKAFEILEACFGVKSPSTLLKRASSFRKYVQWFDTSGYGNRAGCDPFPLREVDVWEYFLWLREKRIHEKKGFTITTCFLESARFAKFVVGLKGVDDILEARRLIGFAALEKKMKGPTIQAPGLDLEHVKRLHEILAGDSNLVDRLGAGCFLVSLYGRARWSDLRFVSHVEIEKGRNGSLTIYTTEHKTSSVGLRREQYLPIVLPWEGVSQDSWVEIFLDVYKQCGLDIEKRPLGPLLPAPKQGSGFCARPLSTSEAAVWLRALLENTRDCSTFRSHSLKATTLIWCAKAGFDKETRSVLAHHCSAVSGSEVVYSRHLQTRALRKLSMLLKRLRIGLGFEEETMKEFGLNVTPAPFTPFGLKTPAVFVPATPNLVSGASDLQKGALGHAIENMLDIEDIQSVKEELGDVEGAAEAADMLSVFPLEIVQKGVIEIDSSSGSSSGDDGSSSDSGSDVLQGSIIRDFPKYVESIPEGLEFFKHVKSGIVHKCKDGSRVSACKLLMSDRYKVLPRELYTKWPKCLRCFPKDHNRIRDVSELIGAVDAAHKKAKTSQ